MNIMQVAPTPATIGTAVWAAATRSILSFGSALPTNSVINQSLATSTTFVLAGSGTLFGFVTWGLKAGAAGTLVLSLNDGINQYVMDTQAAGGTSAVLSAMISATISHRLTNNDAVNQATYCYLWANHI